MISTEALEELKAKHGADRIVHVIGKNNVWDAVFQCPTRAQWKRFRSMAHNPAQKPDAQEALARSCVVYPSLEAFDALLERYPACADASADQLGELAGSAVDESSKA